MAEGLRLIERGGPRTRRPRCDRRRDCALDPRVPIHLARPQPRQPRRRGRARARAAIALDPRAAVGWRLLGMILNKREREREALTAFQEALGTTRRLLWPIFNLHGFALAGVDRQRGGPSGGGRTADPARPAVAAALRCFFRGRQGVSGGGGLRPRLGRDGAMDHSGQSGPARSPALGRPRRPCWTDDPPDRDRNGAGRLDSVHPLCPRPCSPRSRGRPRLSSQALSVAGRQPRRGERPRRGAAAGFILRADVPAPRLAPRASLALAGRDVPYLRVAENLVSVWRDA